MRTRVVPGALIALVVAMSVMSAPVTAQDRGQERERTSAEDREAMMERIRAYMARTIQERLELDESRSAALSAVIQEYDGRRRALGRAEGQARRRVEALLEQPEPDPVEASNLLAEMASLRAQEGELFAEEQEALLEVLTPLQVLQLQEIREDMGRRIRSIRGRSDRDGRRGGDDEDDRRRRRGGG